KVQAVRAKDPKIFLNITSGTWLSPWWVKYANTIWMQGADYGYADVPSISPRDAAITYRDFVLYDDFHNQNQWFPISNLMTHGIIKGNLEMLGGKEEPLDKFTNEVLLYFARGVAMWELYISPDILNDGEWDALGQAMQWARDRFPTLTSTEMIGGDPTKGQTYGYVHYNGTHGVIAVRNPLITENSLRVPLASSLGLDPNAKNLVLERVYPGRWISPQLYSANDSAQIPLNGYETAIYELYPLADAKEPLLAGVPFDVASNDNGKEMLNVYGSMDGMKLLNADAAKIETAPSGSETTEAPVENNSIKFSSDKGSIDVGFATSASVKEGVLSILLTPAGDSPSKKPPRVHLTIDGVADTAKHERAEDESVSLWYTAKLSTGKHDVIISVESKEQQKSWTGNASVWMVCQQQQSGRTVTLTTTLKPSSRILPPQALPPGIVIKNVKLGEGEIGG
ncbi:MAG TPA: hypothetical protein VKS81_05185, partial [Bacteroidota bacterium]|nr:hypothetical protein [Bacteroidota bacterium]